MQTRAINLPERRGRDWFGIDLGIGFVQRACEFALDARVSFRGGIRRHLVLDQVPAYPTAEAYTRIESELARTLHEAYAEIDAEPIAAASLGQVYRARLHSGEEVAVKVQRPDLTELISFDIAIL